MHLVIEYFLVDGPILTLMYYNDKGAYDVKLTRIHFLHMFLFGDDIAKSIRLSNIVMQSAQGHHGLQL